MKFGGWGRAKSMYPGDLVVCTGAAPSGTPLYSDDEAGANPLERGIVARVPEGQPAFVVAISNDVLLLICGERLGWSHRVWWEKPT